MLTYILLLGLLWIAEIAWLSLDLEMGLRLLAAEALILHPIHEQRKGFRGAFNRAVSPATAAEYPNCSWPLSRTMNALQTAGLVTVFPVLAMVGPWWAVLGMFAFYSGDAAWTHEHKDVPGGWSAGLALLALTPMLLAVLTDSQADPLLWQILGAMVTGLLLLAAPWWMAYRRVRS